MACAEDVFDESNTNWGEQIKCLREEIANLKVEIQGATTAQGKFNSKLGSSFNLYTGACELFLPVPFPLINCFAKSLWTE